MQLSNIIIAVIMLVNFLLGFVFGKLLDIYITPKPLLSEDIAIHDFNDMKAMLYLNILRNKKLSIDGHIKEINYSALEDRNYGPNKWGAIRGGIATFILLHPTSSSGVYYIYRKLENILENVIKKNREHDFGKFEVQYLISIFAASMSLALNEEKYQIYDFLVETQSCLLAEITNGNVLTYEKNCFQKLKNGTISLLEIDTTFKVQQGTNFYIRP